MRLAYTLTVIDHAIGAVRTCHHPSGALQSFAGLTTLGGT